VSDVLAFDAVSYSYRGEWLNLVHAVREVSFAVPAGSAYGFLGANGAGKSTSIRLVAGLLTGHRGSIRLFGQELHGEDHALRSRIGYLPEQPYFYDNLAVGEYLAWLARLSGMAPARIPAAVDRVCRLLDLDDLRTRHLRSFSKGMRQRFGLAQAIVHEPDLLILDEPFSGLDPLWRARFKEVMALERSRGATLFFSSHILGDVEDLCDYYGVIDHGRVLEQGRLADLLGQAPLELAGSGAAPAGAETRADGTWVLRFADDRRAEVLAAVPAERILRLERQRIALEDWFVARIKSTHGAGKGLDGAKRPEGGAT
jgi:ABC-2 type transport system ATP-binding protein